MTKVFGPFFLVIPSVQNLREQFIRGFLTNTEEVIISILLDQDVVENTNFLKEAIFPKNKKFGNFFLLVSHMINVKEHFIGVQKVFWHFLCKL